jgi:hypothetical protein
VNLDKLDEHIKAIGEKPEVSGRTTGSTSRSIGKLKGRIETARGKGAIPPPKSAQGTLGFTDEHPVRAPSTPKDKGTSFNPAEMDEPDTPQAKKDFTFQGRMGKKDALEFKREWEGRGHSVQIDKSQGGTYNTWLKLNPRASMNPGLKDRMRASLAEG